MNKIITLYCASMLSILWVSLIQADLSADLNTFATQLQTLQTKLSPEIADPKKQLETIIDNELQNVTTITDATILQKILNDITQYKNFPDPKKDYSTQETAVKNRILELEIDRLAGLCLEK